MENMDEIQIDSKDIQISVPFNEMNNKIESFIKRKREANNMINTRMYSYQISDGNYIDSSRTCSTIAIKRLKGSECFIKKSELHNTTGPQLNCDRDSLIENNSESSSNSISVGQKSDVRERISNLEKCLNIKSNQNNIDIYAKLKSIEDCVLQLQNKLSNNIDNYSSSNNFPSIQQKQIVIHNINTNDVSMQEELDDEIPNNLEISKEIPNNLVISKEIPNKSKYTADEIQNIINDVKNNESDDEETELYF